MDLQLTCTCGAYLVAPAATFDQKVQQHLTERPHDASCTVESIRELARPA